MQVRTVALSLLMLLSMPVVALAEQVDDLMLMMAAVERLPQKPESVAHHAFMQVGLWEQASWMLEWDRRNHPQNPATLASLALVRQRAGDYESAEELCAQSMALKPETQTEALEAGNALLACRQYDGAALAYASQFDLDTLRSEKTNSRYLLSVVRCLKIAEKYQARGDGVDRLRARYVELVDVAMSDPETRRSGECALDLLRSRESCVGTANRGLQPTSPLSWHLCHVPRQPFGTGLAA
ncbi:MAG: hypothetical protein R3E97_19835 [Candidatus Eisenbacteria bacterium]